MSRTWAIVLTVLVLAFGAVYGWLWLSAQRTIPLSVSPSDRAAAVANAHHIADLGPEPANWPVRLFIPASALQGLAGTVAGTTYRVPFGDGGANAPDGYLVATIRKLDFIPTDLLLRARVEMDVAYEPVSRSSWWGSATVRFTGKADMLPVRDEQGGSGTVGFRLVPTGFSPAIRWGPLNVAATEMVSQVIASHFLERLGRDLVIPVPPLAVPINIAAGMSSTHKGSFPAGGSYRLKAELSGGSVRGEMATDRLLIVSSGVWLLGGIADAAASPVAPEHNLVTAKARLARFERTSAHAEAHIPMAPILAMIAPHNAGAVPGSAAPSGYDISAAITEATGPLLKTSLANNRVMGNIYLAVSPASPDFASGTLSFTPLGVEWQKGLGLTGQLETDIRMGAKVRAYLSGSRFQQAIGANMAVTGSTKATIPFTLGLKLMQGDQGSAIMLVPDVQCTRVAVDLRPDESAGPLFSTPFYSLPSAGVRVERNIGGGAAASFALIDSKPHYVPFPAEGALTQGITWPSDGIAVTVAPKWLAMGDDGIDVTVSLHARSAAKAEQARFAAERAGLHAALRKGVLAKPCNPDQQLKLLL